MVAVDSAPAAPGLKALVQARRFVGVAERPPGSNRTPFGRWFGADGEPWCAIFLSYCFKVGAGIVLGGGTGGVGVNANGCAYVPTLERWLRDTDQWLESSPARESSHRTDSEGCIVAAPLAMRASWIPRYSLR